MIRASLEYKKIMKASKRNGKAVLTVESGRKLRK
jgi:hypothetical protein